MASDNAQEEAARGKLRRDHEQSGERQTRRRDDHPPNDGCVHHALSRSVVAHVALLCCCVCRCVFVRFSSPRPLLLLSALVRWPWLRPKMWGSNQLISRPPRACRSTCPPVSLRTICPRVAAVEAAVMAAAAEAAAEADPIVASSYTMVQAAWSRRLVRAPGRWFRPPLAALHRACQCRDYQCSISASSASRRRSRCRARTTVASISTCFKHN